MPCSDNRPQPTKQEILEAQQCASCRFLSTAQLHVVGLLDWYLRHLCDDMERTDKAIKLKYRDGEYKKYLDEAKRLGFTIIKSENAIHYQYIPI